MRAMPANPTQARPDVQIVDGLVTAPIGRRGRWHALRSLRAAMHDLRQAGRDPVMHFVMAVSRDGRVVSGRSPDAALFLLGYRIR